MECCKNCKNTRYVYAGEVFCEILGWTCENTKEEEDCDDYKKRTEES